MSTRDQLLAEIAANPDDDTLRLAFADYLDEQPAGRMSCPLDFCRGGYWRHSGDPNTRPTRCHVCGPDGTVPDTADADRAEFIRVQCELERCRRAETEWEEKRRSNPHMLRYGGNCDCSRLLERQRPCPFCVARSRERDLLDTHPEWSRCRCPRCNGRKGRFAKTHGGYEEEWIDCVTCDGTGDLFLATVNPNRSDTQATLEPRHVAFARGFVDSVHCTLAELGSTTTQHQTRYSDSSFYDEVCVHCEATDARGSNALRGPCVPRFEPTPWALAVVRETPVTRIVMTDREPFAMSDTFPPWRWLRDDNTGSRSMIPDELFDEIPGNGPEPAYDHWGRFYPTAEAARDALALAAGRLVRRHAYPERK